MQLYRIMPTNARAMPLLCSPEIFVDEYFKCWQDPHRATDYLYKLIQPFFKHWEYMLRKCDYQKDLNYIVLCRRLYSIAGNPQILLREYVEYADQVSSVQEELEILFFTRLRSLRYYPKKAAPRMAEYVIAKDFRDRLKDKITRSRKHPIDIPVPELIFGTLGVEDVHPDHLLLKNLGLDTWESYLLELMKLGMTTMEISTLTHLPRKTFANEGNQIWHRLKETWQAA